MFRHMVRRQGRPRSAIRGQECLGLGENNGHIRREEGGGANCLLCTLWTGLSHETSLIIKVKEWAVGRSLLKQDTKAPTMKEKPKQTNELYSIRMRSFCLLKGKYKNTREGVSDRWGRYLQYI